MSSFSVLVFWAALLLVFYYLGIFKHFFDLPQSIHFTRQTDSLAFIHHYVHNGLDFFSPGILNLNSINANAASEFPFYYAVIAVLTKLGLDPMLSLRTLGLVVTSCGLFSFFSMSRKVLDSTLTSLLLTFTLYSSSVWIYYSLGLIPDPIAVGFTLIGISSFWKFDRQDTLSKSALILSLLMFTLASLVRVTYAIYPISIALYVLLYHRKKVFGTNSSNKYRLYVLLLLLGGVLAAAWAMYSGYYNGINNDFYFTTIIKPYWDMTPEAVALVWEHITGWWYASYYSETMIHAIGISLLCTLFFWRKTPVFLRFTIPVALFGFVAYFFLFYHQFKDHDYYMLLAAPLIALSMLSMIYVFKNVSIRGFSLSPIVILGLAVLLTIGLKHSKNHFERRYSKSDQYYSLFLDRASGLAEHLDGLGIPRSARVVTIPDITPNGGLVFAERMGWTLPDVSQNSLEKLSKLAQDEAGYLIVIEPETVPAEVIGPYVSELIDSYQGMAIYRLELATGP